MSQHAIDLLPFPGRDLTVIRDQLKDRTVITVEPQFTKQIHFDTLSYFAGKLYNQ